MAAQLEHDSGMHHMGDLARLVLLRYDLVAKRRPDMKSAHTGKFWIGTFERGGDAPQRDTQEPDE